MVVASAYDVTYPSIYLAAPPPVRPSLLFSTFCASTDSTSQRR